MARRDRPRTDDTNWRLRDNVTWVTEQAKAAREVAGAVRRAPGEMLRDLRGAGPPDDAGIPDGDPRLAAIDGVGFDLWVEAEARIIEAAVLPGERDAVAQAAGVAPGAWPAARAGWAARAAADPALERRFRAHLEHRRRMLREPPP
jgi:hypothetical protein